MLEFEPYDQWKARNKPKRKAPENRVKNSVTDWLDLHHILWNRQHSGMLQVVNPRTRKTYWVHMAKKGSGDLVVCRKGRFVEIETKAPGKGLDKAQRARKAEVEADGGVYIKANSTDDLHILLSL